MMSSISMQAPNRDYPANRDHPIVPLAISSWLDAIAPALQQQATDLLESGCVVFLPQLPFAVSAQEREILNTYQSRRKNVTLSRKITQLRDIAPESEMAQVMTAILRRYSAHSTALIRGLFPAYAAQLITARVSFRPAEIAGREIDPVYDDRRLHADAFPNQPTRGARILRVFNNINPHGEPRWWQVGEPFADAARHFLPQMKVPLPGVTTLRELFKTPDRRRTAYDQLMLQLHDCMKLSTDYQSNAPRTIFGFPPGTTWIVFTDQVLHAAVAGRHMLEQTLHLPVAAQRFPERSPLRVLERLAGRRLARADGADLSAVA
jgi:hypothetical protein